MCRFAVFDAKGRYIGKITEVIFKSGTSEVIGYVVARPRLLFLFDRKDRHLARDAVKIIASERAVQLLEAKPKTAWDKAAEKRLGISWDSSVIWEDMPVVTVSGQKLGKVRDGLFDEKTGALEALGLTAGATADATLGVRDLPARLVRGFNGAAVVVADEAAAVETEGGAAAAAGKAAAVAQAHGEVAAKKAVKAAKTAAVYGAAAAKVAADSKTGKKAIGWLKAMKDEVVDMMGDPDDEPPAKKPKQ